MGASADGCPGKCIHALASLMCDSVLENIQCPASNMRCCVEKSAAQKVKPPPRENVNPLDSLLELELPPRPEDDDDEDEVKEKADKTTTEATTRKSTTEDPEDDEEKSSSSSLKSCPGVCVANRISCFCEAILDVDHLCKADLRCCVAKKVFDDKEKTPKELIIPKNDKRCQDGSNDNEEDEEEIEEDGEEEEVMETS